MVGTLGRLVRGVALALAGCLLLACSATGTPSGEAGTDHPAAESATPTPTPSASASADRPTPSPAPPDWHDAARLARQLEHAAGALREAAPGSDDFRLAAEFEQLAAHGLATAPPGFRSRVLALLPPATARTTRSNVTAAGLLHSMAEPQGAFPRWRIVAAPPAEELLGYYRSAQRRTGVPWTYLAAIHLVESRMGRLRGTSSAGARGPMQFLPSTWKAYGGGGDIDDPADAILAAARLLRANGAPEDMAGALWHYNPSANYVRAVQQYAGTMQRSTRAYAAYWHWRVLYRHRRGTFVLPVGYPEKRPVRLTSEPAAPPAPGTVPPAWLGKRVLPRTAAGFGEIRPTPRVMRVRRWNMPDSIPPLPGVGFTARVTDPAPAEVIARSTWQPACPVDKSDLAWLRLTYWGFDDARHSGEMLVNSSVATDLVRVFRQLYRARFPIESMGIARREDLDSPPTGDGNVTGSFACRPIRSGTSYSQHAYGLAVDLNPFQNPYHRGDVVLPELASVYLDRDWVRPGLITPDGPAVRAFASIGWGWGGTWSSLKDYQHFSRNGR